MEVKIDSLEDMCALMCDNRLPEPYWYFTFGCGQKHAGHYVKIRGTYGEARKKMFERFGDEWAFQYSEQEWNEEHHTETELREGKVNGTIQLSDGNDTTI